MPIAALATFAVATVVAAILLHWEGRLPAALPSARSMHARAIPRVGGLGIIAGVVCGMAWWPSPAGITPSHAPLVAVSLALVAGVSLFDDWRGSRPATRLAVQAVAAIAMASTLPVGWTAAAGIVLATMWMANLFNFIDGSDGIAVSAAICGFTAYAVGARAGGSDPLPYVCIAVACVPFLALNLPPARMFMGDVGAVTLGFAAATLGIAGVVAGAWPAWLPLLAFLTPILDASLTLAARALRGERVWQPHKLHYYQRLNQLGAGHGGTFAAYAACALATSATASLCIVAAPALGWIALAAWVAILALLFAAIDYHWKRRDSTP